MPVSPTDCGLSGALSVKLNDPLTDPLAVGENVTPTVHVPPAATLVPQVLLAMWNPVLAAIPLNVTAALVRLVRVTDFGELVVPTVTVPKLNVLDEKVIDALPVPDSATLCVPASSTNATDPVADPTAVGENVTPTTQEAPAPMLDPQVFVATANPALAAMDLKFSGTV